MKKDVLWVIGTVTEFVIYSLAVLGLGYQLWYWTNSTAWGTVGTIVGVGLVLTNIGVGILRRKEEIEEEWDEMREILLPKYSGEDD